MNLFRVAVVAAIASGLFYFVGSRAFGPMYLPALTPVKLSGTVVITGATSGLGKEMARVLLSWGGDVILACRNRTKGADVLAEIRKQTHTKGGEVWEVDLASFDSVRKFAEKFKSSGKTLRVLVNNAGVVTVGQSVTADGIETTYQVNYLSPFLLTHLLLDTIKSSAPARIINVTTKLHLNGKIDRDVFSVEAKGAQPDSKFDELNQYTNTKLLLVAFNNELARQLNGTGVTVNTVAPGIVHTEIGRHNWSPYWVCVKTVKFFFARSVDEGAKTAIYAATSPDVEGRTGVFFDSMAETPANPEANNPATVEWLWKTSKRLTGLR